MSHLRRQIARLSVTFAAALGVGGVALVPVSRGDLQSQIAAQQAAAAQEQAIAGHLQQSIAQDSAAIAQTSQGIAGAKARLARIQTQVAADVAELRAVQNQLMEARDHLAALEARLKLAAGTLASNLRAEYEDGAPTLMTVIFNSHGFTQLLDQVNFAQRVSREDARIVGSTREARKRVLAEALRLGTLEQRDQTLTNAILSERDQAAALETALLNKEIAQESARAGARTRLAGVDSRLSSVQGRLSGLRAKLAAVEAAAAARARQSEQQAAEAVNASAGNHLAINTAGMVQPPPGAPTAVREMIAAGNAIATLPYIWGGGHGSFISPGYDCSGSVSYVLAAAGLLSSPEISTFFETYGQPGAGQWVTIYSNPEHVWMTIAGWRFDTVALSEYGTRWSQGGGEFSGFTVTHPVGF